MNLNDYYGRDLLRQLITQSKLIIFWRFLSNTERDAHSFSYLTARLLWSKSLPPIEVRW